MSITKFSNAIINNNAYKIKILICQDYINKLVKNSLYDDIITPLLITIFAKNISIAKLLIKLCKEREIYLDINKCSVNGLSPLYLAAQNGDVEFVKLLLKNGADANLCRIIDKTLKISPLIAACFKGYIDIAKLLIQSGADMNYQLCNGRTALMYSIVILKSQPIAKILIQHGADINIKDNYDQTALTLALKGNYLDIAKLLTSP